MFEQSKDDLIEQLGGVTFGFARAFEQRPILYHYTTLAGLIGIVQSNQIWATDLRYLNDISEAKRIWSFIGSRVDSFRAARKSFPKMDLDVIATLLRGAASSGTFVASFSEARDSLGQWRAYSGASGVCIGFKAPALQTQWVANPKGGEPHWTNMLRYKVTYVPDDSSDYLDEEIERLLLTGGPFGDTAVSHNLSREAITIFWLKTMAASFKHSAFAEEKEWRLCFQRQDKPMRNQQFRIVKSMLVPYIAANLNINGNNQPIVEGSYIDEVIVGPSANMGLNKSAVEQLLLAQGHEGVKVSVSGVPYRDW
jgi:hypothetical protein